MFSFTEKISREITIIENTKKIDKYIAIWIYVHI